MQFVVWGNRLPGAFALSLGCGSLVVAAWIYAGDVNDWSPVFAQIGLAYVVAGAMAIYEARQRRVRFRRLLALLVLPGLAVVGMFELLRFTGRYVFYPLGTVNPIVWHVAAFVLPLSYALGRAREVQHQWLVAGVALLSIAVPPLAFVYRHAVVVPGPIPIDLLVELLARVEFVVAATLWTGIPLYRLGLSGRPGASDYPTRLSPAVAVAVVATAFLGAVQVVRWVTFRSVVFDDVVPAIIVFGPVAYFAVRGARMRWEGSDDGRVDAVASDRD